MKEHVQDPILNTHISTYIHPGPTAPLCARLTYICPRFFIDVPHSNERKY